jgi:hypothetical protein
LNIQIDAAGLDGLGWGVTHATARLQVCCLDVDPLCKIPKVDLGLKYGVQLPACCEHYRPSSLLPIAHALEYTSSIPTIYVGWQECCTCCACGVGSHTTQPCRAPTCTGGRTIPAHSALEYNTITCFRCCCGSPQLCASQKRVRRDALLT